MFAGGQLPCLSDLRIWGGEWTPGAMPQNVFLHLSSFHSITSLLLCDITLPSIAVVLRLVCAFDRLESLQINYLRWLDRRAPPTSRRWAPSPTLRKVGFLDLDWPDELGTLHPYGELETSSGSDIILLLSNALSCSDLKQLLHHPGKALCRFGICPLEPLQGMDPNSIQPLRVPDVDLSRNAGLQVLEMIIEEYNIPSALLERAETYGVIQRMISSAYPAVLEEITIRVKLEQNCPLILSHVLLALRGAVCPPDQPLAPERYTSLKSMKLEIHYVDVNCKRQMEADWDRLAPIWFPSFYSRGIIE
ncbi:hypothetical protein WOLCODRAFT_151864 [Wolfiporia cocos MD-104 SS10]|uniref:F-box domain-containing protein n=1 Tax=Wolfiporia cocos (strain MD-104) TaxID=742152 RepID=A0A2H3K067_WOLCO|nr:hypothetical protein WOLCODRAFT_151864 [Wolfiporia cocos MD-104 SS10]